MYSIIQGLHFDLLDDIYTIQKSSGRTDIDKPSGTEDVGELDLKLCVDRIKRNVQPLKGPLDTYVNYIDSISRQDVLFQPVRVGEIKSMIEKSNLPGIFINDFITNDCLSVNQAFRNVLTREEQFLFTNLGKQNRHDILTSFTEAGYTFIEKKLKDLHDGVCQGDNDKSDSFLQQHTNRYSVHLQNMRRRMRDEATNKMEESAKLFGDSFYPHCINPKLFQEFLYLKRALVAEKIFYQTVNHYVGNVVSVHGYEFTDPEHINRLLFMCKKHVDVKNSLSIKASELSIRLMLPPLLSVHEGMYAENQIRASSMMHVLTRMLKMQVDELVQLKGILDMKDFQGITNSFDVLKKILQHQWHLPIINGNLSCWRHTMCLAIILEIFNMSISDELKLQLSRCDNPNRLMIFSKNNTMVYNLENMTIYLCFGTIYLIPKHSKFVYKGKCIFAIIEKLLSE
jgi:hypothetical protein